MKIPRMQRIIIIDQLIRGGKYPSPESLAKKFCIDRRTIDRDIEIMRKSHKAPIIFCKQNKGYYYREENYFLPSIPLTEGEIFSLLLAEKILTQYKNTPYEERLRSSFMKLQKYLPDKFEIEISRFQESCSFDLGFARKMDVAIFEVLIYAITSKKSLKIDYYSIYSNKRGWRTIDPYHLRSYKGEWYLAAYCHNRQGIISFSPLRIKDYEETEDTFSIKEDFSPETFWGNSFGIYKGKVQDVVIWIDEYQSRWISEIIKEGDERVTEIVKHDDGSMTVKMRMEGLEEVQRWVMQYGSHMEVVEPAELREKIIGEIRGMNGRYGV